MSFGKRRILLKELIESQSNYCPVIWVFHSTIGNKKINRIYERAFKAGLFQSLSVHHRNIHKV